MRRGESGKHFLGSIAVAAHAVQHFAHEFFEGALSDDAAERIDGENAVQVFQFVGGLEDRVDESRLTRHRLSEKAVALPFFECGVIIRLVEVGDLEAALPFRRVDEAHGETARAAFPGRRLSRDYAFQDAELSALRLCRAHGRAEVDISCRQKEREPGSRIDAELGKFCESRRSHAFDVVESDHSAERR